MKRARFSQRLVAYLIDNAILGAIYAVLSVIVGTALGLGGFITPDGGVSTNDPLNALTSLVTLIYAFILWALHFLYFGYFFSTGGRTPGKRIMGIKVEERDGGSLSFLRGGLRGTFGYWLSGLVFGLGYLWALFDANGETWHDKVFGTRIIRAQP